ncbi:MAG TPA: penicillin-binding protein 2 [Clostridia bacterium]|nr:penicillin-binding protein 2 [Clostridia bacterium]
MFQRDEKVPQIRLTIVQYGILGVFLILAFGFWRLQVVRSEYYDSLAQQNRIKEVPILAPRGKILDREGRIIVDNYPSFSALLLRNQGKVNEVNLDTIAAGLHIDPVEMRTRITRMSALPGYQPIFLKYDITPEELAFIESHRNEFPELDTITVHRRLYPKAGFAAHLIGYVGEVSDDMLNQARFELYNPGDVVGQSGVEAEYNDILMGKNGSRRVLVNNKGKEVGELSDEPAVPGKQLKLTIDIDVQIAAEEALEGKNGAIIAMDPRTGEVLALVSRPTFDPNAFAVRISSKEWNALITDPAKPLLNKAIQAQLAPGSVFKIIMAVAGWQEGISQTLTAHCNGGGTFYGRFFKCWIKGAHGAVTLPKAIYQSCDVYFYTLAERLGISNIAKYATMFGLGQRTGIDLPQEVSGVMPSEEWKIKNFKQKWYAGETISVGIGQGAVATTPVQLMRSIGAITTGGTLRTPHVAFPDQLPPNYIQVRKYTEEKHIPIDPRGWEIITDAMADVVNPIGTAPSAHLKDIDFAGKTGSAQTISNAALARLSGDVSRFRDNGWFVGVTPRRNPEIVVAVLIEQGEHGYLAARTAAMVIKAYVEKQRRAQLNVAATPLPPAVTAPSPVTPAANPSRTPKIATPEAGVGTTPAEITGVWGGSNGDLKGGRFSIPPAGKQPAPATAAPGMQAGADATEHPARVSESQSRPRPDRKPNEPVGAVAAVIDEVPANAVENKRGQ